MLGLTNEQAYNTENSIASGLLLTLSNLRKATTLVEIRKSSKTIISMHYTAVTWHSLLQSALETLTRVRNFCKE